MPLPVTYLRREPTNDADTLRHFPDHKGQDVQSYRDPDAREKGMARWPWHYSESKPTKRHRYIVMAHMRHRIVWLPDLQP